MLASVPAQAQRVLTLAADPAFDKIVEAAIPTWLRLHPGIDIKVVSRQFADHHTAMTTAFSTSFYLPDMMALQVGYVGRFAQGGGLEDLALGPHAVRRYQARYAPSVPKDLIEAARMDGYGEPGNYWRSLLPLLKSALGTLGLITFIGPLIVLFALSSRQLISGLTAGAVK